MDKIAYYVKEVLKNRIELSDVPIEYREDVKVAIESRVELHLAPFRNDLTK